MPILSADPDTRPSRRRARRLSAGRVRRLVAIGQRWTDSDGRDWRVAQVYRTDRLVLLQSPGWRALHRVSFDQLGQSYELRSLASEKEDD